VRREEGAPFGQVESRKVKVEREHAVVIVRTGETKRSQQYETVAVAFLPAFATSPSLRLDAPSPVAEAMGDMRNDIHFLLDLGFWILDSNLEPEIV
jgi:hypothetical protein